MKKDGGKPPSFFFVENYRAKRVIKLKQNYNIIYDFVDAIYFLIRTTLFIFIIFRLAKGSAN